jgi:glycyl-tRNA synthetase beta chain
MRWGWGTEQFARPIHTIIALLDGDLLPVSFAGVEAGHETFGHRFLSSGTIRFEHAADDYAEKLRAAHVIASVTERKEAIRAGVDAALRSAGGIPIVDEGLIDEVVHLVEWPVPMIGTFDPKYTEIPREVLTTSMRTNQRYFAAETGEPLLLRLEHDRSRPRGGGRRQRPRARCAPRGCPLLLQGRPQAHARQPPR